MGGDLQTRRSTRIRGRAADPTISRSRRSNTSWTRSLGSRRRMAERRSPRPVPRLAVDGAERVIVRGAAVEALVKSGGAHDANLRPLLEWLAVSDDHPTSVKRAAAEAFRGSGGASP